MVSTKSVAKVAVMALIMASMAACTSKPKPVVETAPPPPVEAAPVPQPQAPVAEAPLPGIVPGSQQDFVVNVGDRVYFDTDSSDIRADAQGILAAQAGWLVRYPQVNIRIEGNAD